MEETKFRCDKCVFETTDKSKFNRHLQTKKHMLVNENEYKYECTICHKKYDTQTGFMET